MKIHHLLLVLLITALPVLKGEEREKYALTGKNSTIKTDYGNVIWEYVEDDKLQKTMGGSGGSVFRITVDNTHPNEPHAGSEISFLVVAISGALIKYEDGMPVFEIWGRAGGGAYGRGVMKFVKGKYKSTEGSLFTIHQKDSEMEPVYMPGDTKRKMPLYLEKKG